MTTLPRISFERSIEQFRNELTDAQRKEISGANRKAIAHEIKNIQAKLGRDKGLCRLNRIRKFLDAMEQIEKLVTIFLNVNEVIAFVWGPIKLVLMIAKTWTSCFEKLLDVYEEIADALDNLAFFHGLIRDSERLQRMLEDYFSDILRLHQSVLEFFYRSDWKGNFLWPWRDFRRKIDPIIQSLKQKQARLSEDKLQSHTILKEVQDSDVYAKDQFRQIHTGLEGIFSSEMQRNKELQEQNTRSSLERKLNTSLSQISCQLELPDTVMESSGGWILSNSHFQTWEASTVPEDCVLFLNGCPGAGKSTLARTIIRYLINKQLQGSPEDSPLAYFFFKHNDAERRSTRSMLCQLITQVINVNNEAMMFADKECATKDFLDISLLKTLARNCLLFQRNVTIVLDGLDEAMGKEPQQALEWCLYELLRMAPLRGCNVRLLICGQEDGRIESIMSSYTQIRLHEAHPHQKDIEEYAASRASLITDRFNLRPDDERALIIKVSKAAKGMFLYAKVVLGNLLAMPSRKQFKAELNRDEFPRNLDEAYGRILHRVINAADPFDRESAKKIFGWVVCSQRPLRWREIQSRFCIDADKGICDPDDHRADSCKQLCSSLVDATDCEIFPGFQSEKLITMIHETASQYLVYTNTIDLMREHIDMSLFCCRYLGSRPFFNIEVDEVKEVVQSGYFGFMDYAAVFYRFHIQKAKYLKEDKGSNLNLDTARHALSDLEKVYRVDISATPAKTDSVTEFYEKNREALNLAIQDKLLDIRTIVDTNRDGMSQNTDFQDLQGPKRYQCPKLDCTKFFFGYSSEAELQKHLASHERPFRCNHEHCFAQVVGYASTQELQRHDKKFHNDDSRPKITFPSGNRTSKRDFIDACQAGDLKKVKRLHLLDADPRCLLLRNMLLKVAFESGHGHICKYLIDNGLNPLRGADAEPFEESPIHLAIKEKDLHMLELFLLDYPQLTSSFNKLYLAMSVSDILVNYPPGLDILLRLSATEPPDNRSVVLRSVMSEQLGNLLRSWGEKLTPYPTELAVIDHSNDTAPIHKWFSQLFPRLYDHQGVFSPNHNCQEYEIYQQSVKKSNRVLQDALLNNRLSLAAFLIDIDYEKVLQCRSVGSDSILHSFITKSCGIDCDDCFIMTQRLVKLNGGILANDPNHNGELPLHVALRKSRSPAVLRTLLGCSQNLNHRDQIGRSPIHCVRSEESMSILLKYQDIDLFSRNNIGQTPFAAFCDSDMGVHHGIMRLLLKADIRLAWTTDESTQRLTPLHYAMEVDRLSPLGPPSTAKFLLELPEIEQILHAYLVSPVKDCEQVRKFAQEKKLKQAIEIMDRIGFGSPP